MTTTTDRDTTGGGRAAVPDVAPLGPALVARGVSVHRGDRRLLADVDVSVAHGEVVAVAGPSGAGKTTLLRVLAGLQRVSGGSVVHGHDGRRGRGTAPIGFVPQDDIVHRELSVRSTLRYAAALRLPAELDGAARHAVVEEVIGDLGLGPSADVRVGTLSGGQRKRVNIAVELLGRPDVLLLDEPTSGLDPATAADVLRLLRGLADRGVAVALTTHREADIEACDRLVFLRRGGHVAFAGDLEAALRRSGGTDVGDLYRRLGPPGEEGSHCPAIVAAARVSTLGQTAGHPAAAPHRRRTMAPWRQTWLLARRNAEVMAHNRLTLAVLVGSPLLVTAMMAALFAPGSFDGADASGLGPVQVTFWLAFAGFFFGLTAGLLQVVVERPVLERERFAGLSPTAYLASKVVVLAPFLTAVAAVLVGTLTALDRLPARSWPTTGSLLATLVLESLGALALGLLASVAVGDASQATLALPMLCFPQVLFAGAVVPIVEMTGPGRALSTVLGNRWAFEGLGRGLDLELLGGLPGVAVHGAALEGSPVGPWLALAGTAVLLLALTLAVLRRTTPAPPR
jgi:ABC transport system ATP-binding/permease protein